MAAAAPLRTDVATAIVRAVLVVVFTLSAQEPVPAQTDPAAEADASSTGPVADGSGPNLGPAAIRIVPPGRRHGERLSGRVEIQTLIIDPSIKGVEFFLDGRPTSRITRKPYTTGVELADPPSEQILEVRGYDAPGQVPGQRQDHRQPA